MSNDLKKLLKQPSSSLNDFDKKIEAIQQFLQQSSQAIDPEDQETAQKIIAIGGALQAYTKKIARHTSDVSRSNNPNLDKAVRQEIAAFCQSVYNITQIDLTEKDGKKEFLTLTGLGQTALPKTEGIVIDVTHNANPPPQLPENIKFQKIDGIILPPDLRAGPQTGYGKGWQEAENQHRLNYVLAYLGEQNIRYDPTLLVIGEDPRQYDHMREESYVVVTIWDEEGTPKAQLFVNNYSEQAMFVVAPPLTNEDLTTMGKKALQARKNTIRISFDKEGRWQITLYDSIVEILTAPDTAIEAPSSPIAVTNDGPPLSRTDVKGKNGKIINAFLDNPEETAEALRKAFTEAFGKPASKITIRDLQSNRPVTITLPDETQVTVQSDALYRAFAYYASIKQQCQSLLCALRKKDALAIYSIPKIETSLQQDLEKTTKAICDAVEKVKNVFPKDKDKKPKIIPQTIKAKDPVLTITLPTGDIVEIYMESLQHWLTRKKDQGFPTLSEMWGSPKTAKQIVNGQLITALLGDTEQSEAIIRQIQKQLNTNTTGDLGSSNDPISFKINDLYDWYGTIGQLYTFLYKNNKKKPDDIPTLPQIRDNTYQKTAADAAASGTPPTDPTTLLFPNTNMGR